MCASELNVIFYNKFILYSHLLDLFSNLGEFRERQLAFKRIIASAFLVHSFLVLEFGTNKRRLMF